MILVLVKDAESEMTNGTAFINAAYICSHFLRSIENIILKYYLLFPHHKLHLSLFLSLLIFFFSLSVSIASFSFHIHVCTSHYSCKISPCSCQCDIKIRPLDCLCICTLCSLCGCVVSGWRCFNELVRLTMLLWLSSSPPPWCSLVSVVCVCVCVCPVMVMRPRLTKGLTNA